MALVFKIELLASKPNVPLIGCDFMNDISYRRMYSTKLILANILYDPVFDGTWYEQYRYTNFAISIIIAPRYRIERPVSSLISFIYNGKFHANYDFTVDMHGLQKYEELPIDIKMEKVEEVAHRINEVIHNWPHIVAGHILMYLTRRDYRKDILIASALYGGDTLTADKVDLIRYYTLCI
jgi:hypothetical protein